MKTYPGVTPTEFRNMDEAQVMGLVQRIEMVEKHSASGKIFSALTAEQ